MRKSVLLLLLAAIVVANAAYYLLQSDWSEPEEPSRPPSTAAAPAVAPPPMESLGHGVRMPTAEELEEEARYDEARVAEANAWLNSPLPDKRAAGAEQLSAFPTPSAEMILINTLKLDFDPEVRRAAAQSLSVFKQPTDNSVAALLAALVDDSEEVQLAAFNTLLVVAGKTENSSPRFKNIRSSMKSQASSRHMKNATRKALRAFLNDQESPKFGAGN